MTVRKFYAVMFAFFLPGMIVAGSPDGDYFLEVNKGIDVFGRVYKEITANYVDEVNPEKFMQAGIDAMLGSLDPYTVFIDKEDGDEVDLLTSGKYGGIGVTIGYREGFIQIVTVMDGYSAQRQGVVPGDKILEIDGVQVAGKKPEDVRNLTRGVPGTEVRLLIKREGEADTLQFVLIREEIRLKNITYVDYVDSGIGYVRLERFSRKAGEEMRQAIMDLKTRGALKGLVLDERGNPGGLLDAAVDVVSKFVPKGSLIVSTKGRRSDADREYTSDEEPLLPDVPLVILTDHGSASASEIVAGALQDLDRGLIVGERTFGKGLVQTIRPLNYGAQLKVTTARYFIPSGRSIQEIDYKQRNDEGMFVAFSDSVKKEFHTHNGRAVYEHGGISPDSTVVQEDDGPMIAALKQKSLFFRFINKYVGEQKESPPTVVNDEMVESFRHFLADTKFDFEEETETKIKELRQVAEDLHYDPDMLASIDKLSADFGEEKLRAFDRYESDIRYSLEVELKSRLNGEQGRIQALLKKDRQLETAIGLLEKRGVFEKKIKG